MIQVKCSIWISRNIYEVLQKKLDMVREAMATIRREEAAHKLAAQVSWS